MNCFPNTRLKNSGFTILELLVVIVIIGILATITVVFIQEARVKSRDAKRQSEVHEINNALEMYYLDHMHSYPNDGTEDTVEITGQDYVSNSLSPDYINPMPTDPLGKEIYKYNYTPGPSGKSFSFEYCLEATGECLTISSE